MYSRAPRVTYLTTGSTTARVGPGSYEIDKPQNNVDSYAPFLSLSNRETVFHASGSDVTPPGPGQYNISQSKGHVIGGHSLQNRSRRFAEVVSEVPGPGTYDVSPAGHSMAVQGDPEEKTSRMNRISVLPQLDVPSIPCPHQAHGYEENAQGQLCKQDPPRRDNTLGPAYYSPPAEESSSQRYKGVHFGKMTSKRGEVKMAEGPGPAQYDLEGDHSAYYENINLKRATRPKLNIPRYHEIVTLQEEKKGVPGPGQYNIKSQFEKSSVPHGLPVVNSPFLSQTERFSPIRDVAPPVGAYNDPRCALELLKKGTKGFKKTPFGLTAVRFTPNQHKDTTPGPGAYDLFGQGLAQESVKRAYLGSTQRGGFGSTARRSLLLLAKEEDSRPGPAQYKVEKTAEAPYKHQRTAAFRSVTERLAVPSAANDTPPPSTYNVREAFEKSQGWGHYTEPRTEQARKRQAFLSAAPRNPAFLRHDPDIPGPGQYSPEIKPRSKLALIGSGEARFKSPKDLTPGPGAYELSPAILDTVLKGTFNVTLCNPLLARARAAAPPLPSAQPPFTLRAM